MKKIFIPLSLPFSIKLFLIFFLLLFLSATQSFAIMEAEKISLSKALELALSTNPQLKIAHLATLESENDIKAANRLQNPSLHTYQNMGTAGEGNPQQIGADYTLEVLKRGFRKKRAQSSAKEALYIEQSAQYNLIFEVKKAYFDLLLKKANLKIIEEQKNLSKELLDDAIKEAKHSNLNKTDVIQAKISYNRSIMYYNIAKSAVISAQNHFSSVMNTKDGDFDTKEDYLNDNYEQLLTINPKENLLNFEEVKNYTLKNRKDLLSAQAKVEEAKNNLNVAKSQLIPDIEINGGYAYQTKGISDTGYYQNGAYAGLKLVNIPLIYHYQPEITNAKLEIEKAQLKYEDMKIDIIRTVTDSWEKFIIARDTLNFYNSELLSNSKELLESSIKSLDNKEIDLTSFLVSKKLYLDVMLNYQEALADYYISYAELLRDMNANSLNMQNENI